MNGGWDILALEKRRFGEKGALQMEGVGKMTCPTSDFVVENDLTQTGHYNLTSLCLTNNPALIN
jgi:hypothetical protein